MSLWGKLTGSDKAKKAARKEDRRRKSYEKKAKKGAHIKKISPYSKEQNKLLKWLTKQVTGKLGKRFDVTRQPTYKAGQRYLKDLLDGSDQAFERFKAPMMRQFREEIMPELAEQYAGSGAGRSSAFNLAAAHAGGTLSENLSAQRESLRQGALGQALQYAQVPTQMQAQMSALPLGQQPSTLYEPQYFPGETPKTHGGMIGGLIGAGIGSIGGSAGAMAGYQIGSGLGGAATDVRGSEGDYTAGLRSMGSALGKGLGYQSGMQMGGYGGMGGQSLSPTMRSIEPSEVPAFESTFSTV